MLHFIRTALFCYHYKNVSCIQAFSLQNHPLFAFVFEHTLTKLMNFKVAHNETTK